MSRKISHSQILRDAFRLFKKDDRNKLILAMSIQSLLGMSDIIGILLIGALGSIGVSYVAGFALPSWVRKILEIVNLDQLPIQSLLIVVASLSAILFVSKSLTSMYVSNRLTKFMARKQAELSSDLVQKLAASPYIWLKNRNQQQLIYSSTDGMNAFIVGVISNYILLASDVVLLVLITILLFTVQPSMAIFTLVFFLGFALILNRILNRFASRYGEGFTKTAIDGRNQLLNLLSSYKEIFVFQRQSFFVNRFLETRLENAIYFGSGVWIQQLPKYFLEVALVLGGASLVAFQAWQNDVSGGLGVLLVFIASATRLTPALLRIQTSLIQIRNYLPAAQTSIDLYDELISLKIPTQLSAPEQIVFTIPPAIHVKDLSFRYPDSELDTLKGLNFEISPGSIVALVGASGSGKTSLVDLLLGIHKPISGIVQISVGSKTLLSNEFHQAAYVPQSPFIMDCSLRENIAIGISPLDVDEVKIKKAVEISGLSEVVSRLPKGLDTELEGFRDQLSGGERQRIAIARALYSEPKLLVVDEGTSALDASSESLVTSTLLGLEGKVTTILIAHRLSSIKNVNRIFFLENGRIIGEGNFLELQKLIPEFERQVEIMSIPTNKDFS